MAEESEDRPGGGLTADRSGPQCRSARPGAPCVRRSSVEPVVRDDPVFVPALREPPEEEASAAVLPFWAPCYDFLQDDCERNAASRPRETSFSGHGSKARLELGE